MLSVDEQCVVGNLADSAVVLAVGPSQLRLLKLRVLEVASETVEEVASEVGSEVGMVDSVAEVVASAADEEGLETVAEIVVGSEEDSAEVIEAVVEVDSGVGSVTVAAGIEEGMAEVIATLAEVSPSSLGLVIVVLSIKQAQVVMAEEIEVGSVAVVGLETAVDMKVEEVEVLPAVETEVDSTTAAAEASGNSFTTYLSFWYLVCCTTDHTPQLLELLS
jgi:hypothetical protein